MAYFGSAAQLAVLPNRWRPQRRLLELTRSWQADDPFLATLADDIVATILANRRRPDNTLHALDLGHTKYIGFDRD